MRNLAGYIIIPALAKHSPARYARDIQILWPPPPHIPTFLMFEQVTASRFAAACSAPGARSNRKVVVADMRLWLSLLSTSTTGAMVQPRL